MSSSKDDIRVVVSIDFGTTFSGYAYAHKESPKNIIVEDKWTGQIDRKLPTIIKYHDESCSTVESFGFAALPERPSRRRNDKSKTIELFKLFLLKESLMEKPHLPDKLDYKKVITDYLEKLGDMIKTKLNSHWQNFDFGRRDEEEIDEEMEKVIDESYKRMLIVLTIPAEFDDDAIAIMRDCAYNARLMIEKYSKNLIFTTEPEAAAIHCLESLEKEYNLEPDDSFMVVDCGGGTVDLTRHELLEKSMISEITKRTGGTCGSSFIDKEFIKFLGRKLGKSTIGLLEKKHDNYLRHMVHEFCKRVKIPFTGQASDFKRYEVDLEDYTLLKDIVKAGEDEQEKQLLEENDWLIGVEFDDVKRMFDDIIKEIICLIRGQLDQQQDKKCSVMMLVGGFSESPYLQARIREAFNKTVPEISVPTQPITAVVKGGVKYGLEVERVKNRVLKRTYGTDIVRKSLLGDPSSEMLPNGLTIIFETLAECGKQISVNDKVVREFKPYSIMQDSVSFDMYVTNESGAKFCNDPGVDLINPWKIELPEMDNYDGLIIRLTLTFGTIEIIASAKIIASAENQKIGKECPIERRRLKY